MGILFFFFLIDNEIERSLVEFDDCFDFDWVVEWEVRDVDGGVCVMVCFVKDFGYKF